MSDNRRSAADSPAPRDKVKRNDETVDGETPAVALLALEHDIEITKDEQGKTGLRDALLALAPLRPPRRHRPGRGRRGSLRVRRIRLSLTTPHRTCQRTPTPLTLPTQLAIPTPLATPMVAAWRPPLDRKAAADEAVEAGAVMSLREVRKF